MPPVVGRGHLVPPEADGTKLVDHVKEHLVTVPVPLVGELLREGAVLVDGRPGSINQPAAAGSRLDLTLEAHTRLRTQDRLVPVSPRSVEVLHEGPGALVVDKPAGIHVHPMGRHRRDTLLGALVRLAGATDDDPWGQWRPRPAHRLDRPVSGAIVWATSLGSRRSLQAHLEAGRIHRTYEAIVQGVPAQHAGTIDARISRGQGGRHRVVVDAGGQTATTHWELVEAGTDRSHLRLRLDTGRTHQLRVHLQHLGHPIVGDVDYALAGHPQTRLATPDGLPRILLHATAVQVDDEDGGLVLRAASRPGFGLRPDQPA